MFSQSKSVNFFCLQMRFNSLAVMSFNAKKEAVLVKEFARSD